MAAASLWDKFKTSAYNRLSETLTGEPTPGSAAAQEQEYNQALRARRLDQVRNPPKAPTLAEQLGDFRQAADLSAEMQARSNAERLKAMGAPTELDGRAVVNRQNIEARDALTQNQLDLLSGKVSGSRELLQPVLANQIDLARVDSGDLERILQFNQAQTDQILKAQQSAQTLPMLAGLLATAASLFA
jgi:hypothetical protein